MSHRRQNTQIATFQSRKVFDPDAGLNFDLVERHGAGFSRLA